MKRIFVIAAAILLCVCNLHGQKNRKILYRADMGYYDEEVLAGANRLIGNVKFAQDNELMDLMGLIPGQVTPFGTLNDTEHKVKVLISDYFKGGLMDAHPNDNTATIILKADDVVEVLKSFGVDISYIKL